MKPAYIFISLGLVALIAGCKGDKTDNAAMPAGYEEVDAAFGIRTGGIVTKGGMSQAPVVEFRKGGSYALYPLVTDCHGQVERGSGTLFAKDGTIEDQLPAESGLSLASHPQYKAVVDRLCASVAEARALPDPFSPRQAIAMLYGDVDNNGEAAWPTRIDNEDVTLRVSSRASGEFNEGGVRKQYLVIGSRNPECEAHACGGGIVGVASFVFDKGKWQLESHEPQLAMAGQYGTAPPAEAITQLASKGQPPLLLLDGGCFGNGGYCETSGVLIARAGNRFQRAWEGSLSNDTSASPECESQGHCTRWDARFDFKPATGKTPAALVMKRTGEEWDEEAGGLFTIDETISYQLNAATGELLESSREGGRTPKEMPAASTTEGEATPADPGTSETPAESSSMVNRARTYRSAADAAAEAADAAAQAAAAAAGR